jgi:hypothetical protein
MTVQRRNLRLRITWELDLARQNDQQVQLNVSCEQRLDEELGG